MNHLLPNNDNENKNVNHQSFVFKLMSEAFKSPIGNSRTKPIRTESSKCPTSHFVTRGLQHHVFIWHVWSFLFLKFSCSMSMKSLLPPQIPLTDLSQCVFDFKLSKQWVLSSQHHPLCVTFNVHQTTAMTSGFLCCCFFIGFSAKSSTSVFQQQCSIIYSYEHYEQVICCKTHIN